MACTQKVFYVLALQCLIKIGLGVYDFQFGPKWNKIFGHVH